MSASRHRRLGGRRARAQRGVTAIEFSIVIVIFLMLVCGVLELARSMYFFNALQEVTRRAANGATHVDFGDADALDRVRHAALFRQSAGTLLLGEPVSDLNIRIDYLAVTRAPDGSMSLAPIPAGSMPGSPADNRVACMEDPNGASCIRFVRARICAATAGDGCTALRYRSAFPFVDLPMSIPTAPTIVSAESLGFVPGMLPGL